MVNLFESRPSLLRLLGVGVYEALILVAIWIIGTALFMSVSGADLSVWQLWVLRAFLWLLTGTYFVWCWIKSGQTLAAQTWKVKLVNAQSTPLNLKQAILRYALATASLLACGAGFLWVFLDKDKLFLHDRLLNTHFEQVRR